MSSRSLPAAPRAQRLGLSIPTLLALLSLALAPGSALAAEACPNEQARTEDNSSLLPDCRAYELVSPPDNGGFPVSMTFPILVSGEGRDVVYASVGLPPGTGAIPNGQSVDVFESARAAAGWVTTDVHPEGINSGGDGASNQPLEPLAVSVDGSRVLVVTTRTLSPLDLNVSNPDLYLLESGRAPVLVSHGALANTFHQNARTTFVAANPDLTSVGFTSIQPLNPEDQVGHTDAYLWSDVGSLNAAPIAPADPAPSAPNATLYAVTPEGNPVYRETATNTLRVGVNSLTYGNRSVQISGATAGGSSFQALSPGGTKIYVATADKLLANVDSGADIYAVNPTSTTGLSPGGPPIPPAVICVSCEAEGSGHANGGSATWIGQSADGLHVFFTVVGALYEHDANGTRLVAPAADGLAKLVFSHNGHYAIATTSVALSAGDVNGASDIYELTGGSSPKLITSGEGVASYTPVAVSDAGTRVLYEVGAGGSKVIDEWSSDQMAQVSPLGSVYGYSVLSTAGAELQDVFFVAHDPLVAWDENAGDADVYDARAGGGFPAPTANVNESRTPNPVAPPIPAYTTSLGLPPVFSVAPLPPDSSHAASKPKPLGCPAKAKKIKNAKKRAQALKRCAKPKSKKAGKSVRKGSRVTSRNGGGK